MLLASIPIIMVIVGVLMYALSTNPKLQEVGRIMYAAGVFAIAFAYASKLVTLLGAHGG